nr:class I SAM-dependent methyltransferase [Candidatus Sigynarchaeota archaeon]
MMRKKTSMDLQRALKPSKRCATRKENPYSIQSKLDLPYLPTPDEAIEAMFPVLAVRYGLVSHSGQKFIDLGAGDGRVVEGCARVVSINATGVEIDPALVTLANKRLSRAFGWWAMHVTRNVKIIRKDLFQANLSPYDFVFIFAQPHVHKYLHHVFLRGKDGAIVVSSKHALDALGDLLSFRETITVQLETGEWWGLHFYTLSTHEPG